MKQRGIRGLLVALGLAVALWSGALVGTRVLAAGGDQDNGAPDVSVSIDRTRVTVGDPISLTVVIRHAANVSIETTSIDDQLGALEPLGSEPPEDRPVGAAMELRLRYKLAAYHTGTIELPVLAFTYTQADGTQGQVQSKAPVPITVQSILPADADPTDIRPLKPQTSLPAPASERLLWAAGVGGIATASAGVGVLTYLLFARRRRPVPLGESRHVEAARAELDRIMALGLLDRGELVEHYRLLAICIRRYLTDRFGFPAVALTTGELERQMEARGIARWPARLISGLLSECDAVTYARYVPAAPRCEADNAMAYEILDATDRTGEEPVVRAV